MKELKHKSNDAAKGVNFMMNEDHVSCRYDVFYLIAPSEIGTPTVLVPVVISFHVCSVLSYVIP